MCPGDGNKAPQDLLNGAVGPLRLTVGCGVVGGGQLALSVCGGPQGGPELRGEEQVAVGRNGGGEPVQSYNTVCKSRTIPSARVGPAVGQRSHTRLFLLCYRKS